MPIYAICRIQKIKSWGELGSSALHTIRARETPNASPLVKNIRLIGGVNEKDLETLFKEKIGNQKIRSNAVLGVEILLSASPEYFRPSDPSRAGVYNIECMNEFAAASTKWLRRQYNDRVVRAELHLDEATPHIHAYIVPLDKQGKLNCRALFNGRQKLSQLQDSFASAVKHLGIERGIKGSRATHTAVKEYYASVLSDPLNLNLEYVLPQPTQNQNAIAYQKEVKETLQPTLNIINHQLADRQRVLKEKAELAETAHASELQRQKLEQRIQELELEILSWKAQADLLRDLSLSSRSYQLGLFEDKKGPHRWRGGGHIINIADSKFYDFGIDQKGGGGAIDLVMHVNQCNFKEAVVWLSDRFGSAEMIKAVTHHIRSQAEHITKHDLTFKFTPTIADESHWINVQHYLSVKRKLPESLIKALHKSGLIYADKSANAVFVMRNFSGETTGTFLRGTFGKNNTFIGFAPGTKRTAGWFHLTIGGQASDPISRAVLVKSPIEALSVATLMRSKEKTIYLAADSARCTPVDFLTEIPKVIAAYDNDLAGDETAKQIKQLLPHVTRLRPKAKDWNEQLSQHLHINK